MGRRISAMSLWLLGAVLGLQPGGGDPRSGAPLAQWKEGESRDRSRMWSGSGLCNKKAAASAAAQSGWDLGEARGLRQAGTARSEQSQGEGLIDRKSGANTEVDGEDGAEEERGHSHWTPEGVLKLIEALDERNEHQAQGDHRL